MGISHGCTRCDAEFANIGNLMMHLEAKHGITVPAALTVPTPERTDPPCNADDDPGWFGNPFAIADDDPGWFGNPFAIAEIGRPCSDRNHDYYIRVGFPCSCAVR